MTHQHFTLLARWTRRISPIALAAVLVLPAIPAAAAPEGSRSKQQTVRQHSVERHQPRSAERGGERSGRNDRRDYRGDNDRHDRHDRYDRHDRHDRYDRHDRHSRDDWHDRYDRHRHHSGPYFFQTHVHRHYRPYFTIPRVITFGHDSRFDPYYWGRVYHDDHHHFHTVYYFPVYVDDDLVYRPYSYCEGNFYATGYFTAQGPHFDITLSF